MCAGETVQSAVNKGKDGHIHVSFEPERYDLYIIYVTFNKEPIPGMSNIYYFECFMFVL